MERSSTTKKALSDVKAFHCVIYLIFFLIVPVDIKLSKYGDYEIITYVLFIINFF